MPLELGILGLLVAILAGAFVLFYVFIVEPVAMLRVRPWSIKRPDWKSPIRIAVLSDAHVGEPFVGRLRLRRLVERINQLPVDLIVILGDLTPGHKFVVSVPEEEIAQILSDLKAPLGVFAVLGNHDWWEDRETQARGDGMPKMAHALEQHGIPVLENRNVTLANGTILAGLGDQLAFHDLSGAHRGVHDIDAALAGINLGDPTILLAHEPDIFPHVPATAGVTLSGHTHGGQVRLFGWSPIVPSAFGNRYAYGHVHEDGRDLVVSGGIGCSIFPVRFGMMPEITLVKIEPGESR